MEPVLLEDAVAQLLAAEGGAEIALLGRRGAGKTTAMRHLLAVFGDRSDLQLVDDEDSSVGTGARVVVRAMRTLPNGSTMRAFTLAPLRDEDCADYLAQTHPDQREAVLAAWRMPAPLLDLRQRKDLVCAVLEHQATVARVDPQHPPPDAFCALAFVLATKLGQRRAAARAFSLRSLGAGSSRSQEATESMLTQADRHLLDCACVRAMLAAEELVRTALQRAEAPTPPRQWPQPLVDAIAHLLLVDPVLVHELADLSMNPPKRPALLLSILAAAEPSFRPPVGRYRDLSGARLCGIDLRVADLVGANLQRADFTGAQLCDADLRGADLSGARLTGADLTRAVMTGCNLTGAELEGADLREAALDPGVREMHAKVRRNLGQSAG
jgi:energy-coupling factor transporter ATP-binding protein EcfA2